MPTIILQLTLAGLLALGTNTNYLNPLAETAPAATPVTVLAAPSVANMIEAKAHEAGVSVTLAKGIAFCESANRQFTRGGEVLRGKKNPQDIGLFQINEKYHLEKALALGYDIYTTEGNAAYALHLMDEEGGQPWSSSRACWAKKAG